LFFSPPHLDTAEGFCGKRFRSGREIAIFFVFVDTAEGFKPNSFRSVQAVIYLKQLDSGRARNWHFRARIEGFGHGIGNFMEDWAKNTSFSMDLPVSRFSDKK